MEAIVTSVKSLIGSIVSYGRSVTPSSVIMPISFVHTNFLVVSQIRPLELVLMIPW